MKNMLITLMFTALITPFSLQAADTGFLEGEAQEVIIKIRTADGKLKWFKVNPDGSRKEISMKPGDRLEFLYEDSVDLNAITVKPKQ